MNEKELIEKYKAEAQHGLSWAQTKQLVRESFKAGQKEATETIQQILLIDVTCASGELTHLANDEKLYKYITQFRFNEATTKSKVSE